MEQNIAILIADLSGYTALTDAHGASTAADLIDKYIEIVEKSLVGDTQFYQQTGDEVIVVSTSADHLISTAVMMIQNTINENKFLQVHGGLHYGKILKRNNNYFGTTINLTSRIASKARPGTVWCSADYLDALENKSSFNFEAKGQHSFKNLSRDHEVFELITGHTEAFYIDPVCRMMIHREKNVMIHPETPGLYFCSKACLDIYLRKESN